MDSVLLLAPSRGMGGGIERYVATLEAAFCQYQVRYRRLDLASPGQPAAPWQKIGYVREVVRTVRDSPSPVRLVLAHRNLLPILHPVARMTNFGCATVIVHGCENWTSRGGRGRWVMRHYGVRVLAVSNFTAGALMPAVPAAVLHPGVSADWYRLLVEAGEQCRKGSVARVRLMTAFRLQDWREKGLPTIIDAIRVIGDPRIRLTVCGAGPAPADLVATMSAYPWCELRADLSDRDLADSLAGADLFVLATRTRGGAHAYGEGFGLVLLEAQLAGTPVIAPAYGGSGEAFQPGLTGVAPADESPAALATVLRGLVDDDQRRTVMGREAASWSRSRFAPAIHNEHVIRALLGGAIGPTEAALERLRQTESAVR